MACNIASSKKTAPKKQNSRTIEDTTVTEVNETYPKTNPVRYVFANVELFAAYASYDSMRVPFRDGRIYRSYAGLGFTWGGNRFSYAPNLQRRLARDGRFDFMPVFPVRESGPNMFGLYLYSEIKPAREVLDIETYEYVKKGAELANLNSDALFYLPEIPLGGCPAMFRAGYHSNMTARWLSTSINNIEIRKPFVAAHIFEFETWFLFEAVPIGITIAVPQPLNEYPL